MALEMAPNTSSAGSMKSPSEKRLRLGKVAGNVGKVMKIGSSMVGQQLACFGAAPGYTAVHYISSKY